MRQNRKFLILISFFLIISFFTTSLISYFVSLKSIRTQISQKQLPITSDNIYSEVQNDILKPIFISSLMANDTFLRDWVLHGENNHSQVVKYLQQIKIKYEVFTSFFVSDKTLRYYYYDGILKTISKDEPRDVWYFRVKEMKNDYEINVDIDMANNDNLAIFINYKVYDFNHNFIGTAGVGLKVDSVKKLIERYQERYDSTILFVNSAGDIKLSSSSFDSSIKNIKDFQEMQPVIDNIFSKKVEEIAYNHNGKSYLLNSRYIPEFDWFLLVKQSDEHEKSVLLRTLFINILICLIITVIVIGIMYFVLSRYQKRLEDMALNDDLTQTFNRKAFSLMIDNAIKDFKRTQTPFSIILFDIDAFKEINDGYGHLVGDSVLQQLSRVIKSVIRDNDTAFRWGGDEFVVILKSCNLENACLIAEKIRTAIQSTHLPEIGEMDHTTISIGVAQYQPGETETGVIKRADELLYKAKTTGKNKTMS